MQAGTGRGAEYSQQGAEYSQEGAEYSQQGAEYSQQGAECSNPRPAPSLQFVSIFKQMQSRPFMTQTPAIHPDTRLGPIVLRVRDVQQSLTFYQDILGFHLMGGGADFGTGRPAVAAGHAVLAAADGEPLVTLRQTPGAAPVPHASGLYHFAVLLPTRAALGRVLQRLMDSGIRFGQSDHLVSEALYLSDPDGNGIEIYRDRPRADWTWHGGRVEMTVAPLDLPGVLEEAKRAGRAAAGTDGEMPGGTRIGHIHLQVSDVEKAVKFYHDILGFDITASYQGAAFLSAGGYHHHLGLNSWNSRGAPAAPAGSAGLETFTILSPSTDERDKIGRRLAEAGVATAREGENLLARDPWNIGIELAAAVPPQR
jgi:catechol 2,3-dioxygenase